MGWGVNREFHVPDRSLALPPESEDWGIPSEQTLTGPLVLVCEIQHLDWIVAKDRWRNWEATCRVSSTESS